MNNRTFINSCDIWNVNAKEKRNWNLFFEKGVLYSYGYHYPLCFEIDGIVWRNTRGYSVTTSKHISLCNGVCVELINRELTKENLLQSFLKMKLDTECKINECVRETSQKKTLLLQELEKINDCIAIIN